MMIWWGKLGWQGGNQITIRKTIKNYDDMLRRGIYKSLICVILNFRNDKNQTKKEIPRQEI